MLKRKIIGLDLGSKTLGIAISDSLHIIARGLETYKFIENDYNSALSRVKQVCKENDVGVVILGYPKHMSNRVGEKAKLSEEFKKMIEAEIDVEVILLDERWSTTIAESRLIEADVSRKKRKEIIDKMAAVVILQNYLDSKGGS